MAEKLFHDDPKAPMLDNIHVDDWWIEKREKIRKRKIAVWLNGGKMPPDERKQGKFGTSPKTKTELPI